MSDRNVIDDVDLYSNAGAWGPRSTVAHRDCPSTVETVKTATKSVTGNAHRRSDCVAPSQSPIQLNKNYFQGEKRPLFS